MKKLITICLFIATSFTVNAQEISSGDYSVKIKNLTEVYTPFNSMTAYEGDYTIYEKGKKIAKQKFSSLKAKSVVTVNIRQDERSGNTVTYDNRTKTFEFMGKKEKFEKSDKIDDIILNAIHYYAKLIFTQE